MKIILGSSSPNRKEVFDRLGIEYKVSNPDYEEIIIADADTSQQVETFAAGKAASIYPRFKNEKNVLILGFDSMIQCDGKTLGKAKSEDETRNMIQSFSGKLQQVITGFCLCGNINGEYFEETGHVATHVGFRSDISASEIENYLAFNDWQGKCGAYSILGPGLFFLDSIEGDFQNIIGVPLLEINKKVQKITGMTLLDLAKPKQ